MSFKNLYIKTYWKYFRSLEKRLARTEDYVAFDSVNAKAYSIEYLTLLQTTCSEIDVVGKAIASHFNPGFKAKDANIRKWGYEVQKRFPGLITQTTTFRKENAITPWDKWTIEERLNKKGETYLAYAEGCGSPNWWNAYNAVKHARTTVDDGRVNYHRANQKNVIDALAALYVMHRLMIAELDPNAYILLDRSELFRIPDWYDDLQTQFAFDEQGKPYIISDDELEDEDALPV